MSDVNKSELAPYRWVILAVSMLGTFIGSYAQFQLPPLAYKLIPDLHLSSSQFAALMAGPMTGSLFICILGGALADRFGVKKVVAVGLVVSVIGCYFRYAVTSFWPFLFMTILAGLASGLLIGNLAKLFGAWFPPEQMGTIMGICMISPALAMFAGTSTTAFFPSEASAFIFSGILCLIILILWLIFARNKPEGAPDLPVLAATQYLGKAARSRSVWFAGTCLFFVMGAIMTFSSFLPNVLRDLWNISAEKASVYASMPILGGVFGCFLGPMICNRMGVMKRYLIIVGLLSGAATFWSWQLPLGTAIVVALIVAGFLQYSVQPLFASLPMLLPEIGPVYAGSAGGIIATVQVLGAVVLPTFVITPLAGSNTTMLFGLAALSMALMIVPVLFLPELGTRALAKRKGND
ncbi:MAG: major facilitator superfamily 1 [Acidobacteria bacterium]|nr:major facilitator superfamily 1 [Acidobacteriota bacterium]